MGVDGLNIQGCAMVACDPTGIEAKVPRPPGSTVLWPVFIVALNEMLIGLPLPKSLYELQFARSPGAE